VDFVNESEVPAGWTLGFEPDGAELLVVAIKATFSIPADGQEANLADEQAKLIEADEFSGEPGLTAPVLETDYAHRKPMCDVILNGSAYAPNGRPSKRIEVALKVGPMQKSFNAVGARVWQSTAALISASEAEAAVVIPISYGHAFGGIDAGDGESDSIRTYLQNPVGLGYSHYKRELDGKPMPTTEEIGRPITDPNGMYTPKSFGYVGRSWQARAAFAGTYDQKWLESQAPFWPDDFDYRYFQGAALDQQIPHLSGGEEVHLQNLTPNGAVRFKVPTRAMPVLLIPYSGAPQEEQGVIDTLLIEPDKARFSLTWRVSHRLRKNCFELRQVIVGKSAKQWLGRRRFGGKPYYRNLAELVGARRAR
jgi:hypothetical protein